jgi:hypothetical protein
MESKDENPTPKKKRIIKKQGIFDSSKDPIVDPTKDQIRKLLQETLLDFNEEKKRSRQDIEAMVLTMQEFMKCFIVIGYNLKNDPVMISYAKNQLDVDALQTSLARLFFSMNHGNGGML